MLMYVFAAFLNVNLKLIFIFQGYHDICVTFLLVVGEDKSFALVDKLSTVHLR